MSEEEAVKLYISETQKNCSHKDISNWIHVEDTTFIKICLTCDKLLETMEIE